MHPGSDFGVVEVAGLPLDSIFFAQVRRRRIALSLEPGIMLAPLLEKPGWWFGKVGRKVVLVPLGV